MEDLFELTNPQKSIWATEEFFKGTPIENIAGLTYIKEKIDFDKLEKAINIFIKNNDGMRLKFVNDNNIIKQYISKYESISFNIVDVGSEKDVKKLAKKIATTPFNIFNSFLFELQLYKYSNGYGGFIIVVHHLIADAWSAGLIISEILNTYNALLQNEDYNSKTNSYKTYIESEKSYLLSKKYEKDKDFWAQNFNSILEAATFPSSKESSKVLSKAKRKQFKLPTETMNLINFYCKAKKISPFNFFMSVYSIYLSRITGLQEFVIGTPLLNRSNIKEKHTIGMFISVIPFIVNVNYNKSFTDFTSNISSNFFSIFRHQKYPYQMLLQDLREKNTNIPNLFNIIFSYQNMRTEAKTSNIKYETSWIFNENISNDLDIHFFDINDSGIIDVAYDYKIDKYSIENIYDIHARVLHIINQILENPNILLKDIEIVTPDEQNEILYKFNNTKMDYPKDKTIVQLFEEQVQKTPNNIALVFGDQKLTYKELDAKANRLANYLNEICPETNNVIGIHLEKNINYIVSILATLKSGNIFLPISTLHPKDRIEYILKDSKTKVLISNQTLSEKINFSCSSLDINNFEFEGINKATSNIENSNDIAYILYTSGSTGKPKGVKIKNYSLINHVYAINKKFNNKITANDKCLSIANISFDASLQEIFIPLLLGSSLYVLPDKSIYDIKYLSNYILTNNITFAFIPPNILDDVYEFLKNNNSIQLDKLLVGVEKISFNTLNKYLSLNPNMQIHNGYGPTEATICCISYMYNNKNKVVQSAFVPIGSPLANNKILIVDPITKRMQPISTLGEIIILGDQVANGYTNKKLNTPFYLCPYFNEKAYCTGDFGYFKPNGDIIFVGRKDNQVKINGHRIELFEIDNVIQAYKDISKCISLIKNRQIISFFVSPQANIVDDLKEYLKDKLPNYMVPYKLVQIESLPITKNGKVDKDKLLSMDINNTKTIVAPSNETEQKLFNIFAKLLKIDNFSTTDSFFDLGGDSLAAIKLSVEIGKTFSKEISVPDIFNNPSIQDISKYIEKLNQLSNINIPVIAKSDYYPTSSAQKRIYFASSIAGEKNVLYNISGGIILDGQINYKKLEDCFKKLVDRHESLRTYFELKDNNVVQKIEENVNFKLEYSENKNFSELNSLFTEFVRPFDLSKAPLFRAKLISFNKNKSALLVDMHHIISDGTSMSILAQELSKLYNDEVLPELKTTYKDFSTFEKNRLISGELDEAKKYWVEKFKDEIPVLNLPTKTARPAIQSFEGSKEYFSINLDVTNKIDIVAKELGVTPYMIMLAAYFVLLYKYTSQDDIVIGTPVVGRDISQTYNIIGMFVNSLAIREKINSKTSFKKFLEDLKVDLLNSYKNQAYPFDELVNQLNVPRDTSRNPIFNTMFAYQNNGYTSFNFNGISSKHYIRDAGISKFDLSVEVIPHDNGLDLSFEYATKLFSKEFIKAMLNHYLNILYNILNNMDIKIADIEMMSQEEKNKILYEFNNTKMDYPKDKTIIQLFEKQVEKTPNNIAVVFENQKLTYKELNERANSLASFLKNIINKNETVGIMLNRSFETIISILAVLKNGGIYTLLDKALPSDRINYILKNCMAKLLITDNSSIDYNIKTINITSLKDLNNCSNLVNISTPKDNVAIIYTSGSTGKPKGVLLHDAGIVNLVYAFKNILELSSSKSHLGFSAVTFDMFTVELFSSLLLGRTLYLLNDEEIKNPISISNIIINNNIDFLICTPTKMELLLSNEDTAKCLKILKGFQLGGEVFTPELYDKLSKITKAKIYNGYGPTEITACCSNKLITSKSDINIGSPIPNTQIYILDEQLNLCPINIAGELCVSGVGIANGYINAKERTSKVFVKSPFDNTVLYKTGDIAYYDSNGELHYIGRNDLQVKINGIRIELAEIERQFLSILGINSCVVIADKTKTFLKAFFVANKSLNVSSIRKELEEKLPLYMIPKYIEQLSSIPTTSNGKVDRIALSNLITKIPHNNIEYIKPENELQEKFCTIWGKILGVKIGIDNNLFELGADSLSAIKFKVEALKEGINISYADIFKYKTIRKLSEIQTDVIEEIPIKNYNYDKINKLLAKNKIYLNYNFNINKNNNVLLFGSNGFIGMHIINSFIKNDNGKIYCLMRDKNGKNALNRFLEVLHYYFGNSLDSYIGNRIIILEGNILENNFGLNESNYKKIIDDIQVIINAAANVKHYGDFNNFKNINIDAINTAINFCKKYSKKLIHLSTLSTSGNMFIDNAINNKKVFKGEKKHFSEKNLFVNQTLDNVYARSKFEAERMVLENIASNNMNGIVLRLGNITSRYSDGKFQINAADNAFSQRLKTFVNLGVIPKSLIDKKIEFTPVDLCADSIIKCLQYSNKTTSVLHIYNRHHIKISKILNVLKEFNLPINIIDDNVFSNYINSILLDEHKKNYINGIINDFTEDKKLIYDSNIYIKSDFSVQYLLRCNFKWSKINRDYIIKYIAFLKAINYFTKE